MRVARSEGGTVSTSSRRRAGRRLAVLTSLLVLAAACGSDEDGSADGSDARRVEASLTAQLAKGEVSGRVVDLGIDPPKVITCTKDPERKGGWRCDVTTAKGRSIVCVVGEGPQRKPLTPVCGPVDY
jgi:hypothetical protein